ncbi:winged helix-turn-helix domain-containing protein [Microbacterium sp. NPDC056052]|uniref:helix-turn-helix domain-containing protein n=1 Tax=Microbacterium sp. NPDC056052 TaxID=3345695 RepID=UPI0035D9161A
MDDRASGAALAGAAQALAQASRATMLVSLLDGRAWTVTELASAAGIGRPTATEHVHVLVDAGLAVERRQGRHRYLRLADARAASIVEELLSMTSPPPPRQSWRAHTSRQALDRARVCYDHLAGSLGVGIFDACVQQEFLDSDKRALTPAGEAWCASLGIDAAALRRARRPAVLRCLDWTERRDHLAGGLGAALMARFEALEWITRRAGTRAIEVTTVGREGIERTMPLAYDVLVDAWHTA